MSFAPFAIAHRELWLPSHIRGTQLPAFRGDAHGLTLTGAQKRTTADGVHFTGAATSNIVIAANAGQNNKAACHITIRFKLDTTFAAGAAADFYLFQKLLAADDYLRVYLKAVDGKLYWEQGNLAAGIEFTLTSTTVSWTAGTWYIVTLSLTDGPVQRLLVNGTLEDSDAVVTPIATPNGGDIVIGSSSDGGVDGVVGTISWVVIGVGTTALTALTAAQETDLSKGVPPPTAKVQHMLLLDEGMGVTAYDRGALAVNGTLDTACTWAFGQVRQPVLSLDGLNDYGLTAAVVDIMGDITQVVVVKAKSTYNAPSALTDVIWLLIDGNNYIRWMSRTTPNSGFEIYCVGSGAGQYVRYSSPLVIDNYYIFILTLTTAGVGTLYINGSLSEAVSGIGRIAGSLATVRIGVSDILHQYSNPKHLETELLTAALTAAQVKTYSKWLKDRYNLPIAI